MVDIITVAEATGLVTSMLGFWLFMNRCKKRSVNVISSKEHEELYALISRSLDTLKRSHDLLSSVIEGVEELSSIRDRINGLEIKLLSLKAEMISMNQNLDDVRREAEDSIHRIALLEVKKDIISN